VVTGPGGSGYFLRLQNNSSDVTVDYFETVAVYSTISAGLVLVAGALLIRVVRQITEWQSTPCIAMEHTTHQQAT
jgi:hypothetical protein